MPIRRVHIVNSVNVSIPMTYLRGKGFLTFIFVLCAACTSTLIAQQEIDIPDQTLKQRPNPFRTDSASSSNVVAKPLSSDSASVLSPPWIDVIRLTSLPEHVEPPVITAISVSRNGNIMAAAGDDHAIRIVDLTTGKTTATLTGHLDWVQCVEFSPNGMQLASCGNDGTLRIWSLGSNPKMISKQSVAHALMTLSYLDDDCVYAAGFSNRIYRYDGKKQDLAIAHACDCRDIRSIVVSPDRNWIAFGGRDGVLRMRRVELAGQPDLTERKGASQKDSANALTVHLHSDRIRTLQFSEDGLQITSVGEDRLIVHYDLVNRSILAKTVIGGGKLLGLCQLEPHLFAIASSDNTIRIISDVDGQVQARLVGHDGSVSVLKRTQKHLISGSFDTTIRIWDMERAIASIDNKGRYVHPVASQFEDSGAGVDIK